MKYNEFKELVVAAATERHVEEYELFYTESDSLSVEALHHEINGFSSAVQAGACFRCIHNGKMGYAATELFTAEEADRIVEAAMANADSIENNESAFIYEAGDTYEDTEPVIYPEPSAAQLIDQVLAIQEAAYKQDSRIIDGTQSMAAFERSAISLTNSKGLDLSYANAYAMAYCGPVAKDGDELFNGFKMKAGSFEEINPEEIAKDAVEDAVSTIGADTVATGSYTLVFSNKMTATLLSTFFSAFSGEAAQRGISLLAGKEGQEVAASLVTITDDPFHKDSLIRMPFDCEGVASKKKHLVENGKLTTLLHNLTTAAKAGIASTGNGMKAGYASPVSVMPYNFYMEPGQAGSKEDIFRSVENGIYITELNGIHAGANPVTGDFSLSSAGYLIADGKQDRPLKNFTISGNYYQLLKKISMVGSDLEFQSPRGMSCFGGPSIVVEDMAVAGK